jgi:hypothetical protein
MPLDPQFPPRQAELTGWRATPRFCLLAALVAATFSCLGCSRSGSPAEPDSFNTKRVLDLPDGRKVEYGYCSIANTGVGLALLDDKGKEIWRTSCNALSNVGHSKYHHKATVEVDGNRLKVTSRASAGTFIEWLDLETGMHIRRRATDEILDPNEPE